jgi:hypothetical protein
MGCVTSKHIIFHLDDSLHVALKRDKKKDSAASRHYTPRAPHPLLVPKKLTNSMVDDSTTRTTSCYESDENAESEFILFHNDSNKDSREGKPTRV